MADGAEAEMALVAGLDRALARAGLEPSSDHRRLAGGANMESWRLCAGGTEYVLRRAPSLELMADHPFGHDVEAAVIARAREADVRAPEIMCELSPQDGIGSGFVMRALPGTADPATILATSRPAGLARDAAGELALIHAIDPATLPAGLPEQDTSEAQAALRDQFAQSGGDRPVIALALAWLRDNLPPPVSARLVHGDFRLGNLLVEDGQLTGVLDWELAHRGDPHEDLAYACMTVWRFARIDRPALGLASLEDWIAAYESAGGGPVDRARLRYWLVHRTCWWALGCLGMARMWREGGDRSLERVVISRRAGEQELDLLMLLEEEAPEAERARPLPTSAPSTEPQGEAGAGEIATAVAEWLGTVKHRMEGHDRFQSAVARNALGMIAREAAAPARLGAAELASHILGGEVTLATPGLLAKLRRDILDRVAADTPKYPALAVARDRWETQ